MHRVLVEGGMREPRVSLQARAPPRRRRSQSLWFWRWAIGAVSLVMWVYVVRLTSKLGAKQPTELGDVLRSRSPSVLCAARLAAVLPPPPAADAKGSVQSPATTYLAMRRRLYQALEDSLSSQGLRLGGGERDHQGLALGNLFRVSAGRILPVLHPLAVPVRAVVVPFSDPTASAWLSEAVQRYLAPILPKEGLWPQDPKLYHGTVFHASTHMAPVPATPKEVQEERAGVEDVARRSCPLEVVLERVVATPSGTVLALWQLTAGTDPAQLRRALRAALPNAPTQQVVNDEAILHTTLARVVAFPQPEATHGQDGAGSQQDPADLLQHAVKRMTADLCGLQTVVDTLWLVEEQDRLALALEGRFTRQAFPLLCQAQQRRHRSGPRQHRAMVARQPQDQEEDGAR